MQSNDARAIWRCFLAALAVWRLIYLPAEESGPWEAIARVRARLAASSLGRTALGRGMDCFYCLSLWVSLPMAILLSDGWLGLVIQWPVLSAAASLSRRAAAAPGAMLPRGVRVTGGGGMRRMVERGVHYV